MRWSERVGEGEPAQVQRTDVGTVRMHAPTVMAGQALRGEFDDQRPGLIAGRGPNYIRREHPCRAAAASVLSR